MSEGSFNKALVLCPFYRKDTDKKGKWLSSICCEGFMDGCLLTSTFYRQDLFQQHMDVFCKGRYSCCEVYRMIMAAKYEDEAPRAGYVPPRGGLGALRPPAC